MKKRDTTRKRRSPSKGANKLGWFRVVTKVKSQLEESNSRKQEESTTDRYAGRTANYTLALAVIAFITLFAACATGLFVLDQVREMSTQTGLMNIAAKQTRRDSESSSLDVAKQITILQGQLTQQRNSTEMEQRPWLGVHAVRLHVPYDSKHLGITVILANSGKSPAFVSQIDTKIGESFAPFTTTKWIMHKRLAGMTVAPNVTVPLAIGEGNTSDIGEPAFKQMQDGTLQHHMVASIYYEDAFKHRHTTKICMILTGKQEDMSEGNPFPTCSPNTMR